MHGEIPKKFLEYQVEEIRVLECNVFLGKDSME